MSPIENGSNQDASVFQYITFDTDAEPGSEFAINLNSSDDAIEPFLAGLSRVINVVNTFRLHLPSEKNIDGSPRFQMAKLVTFQNLYYTRNEILMPNLDSLNAEMFELIQNVKEGHGDIRFSRNISSRGFGVGFRANLQTSEQSAEILISPDAPQDTIAGAIVFGGYLLRVFKDSKIDTQLRDITDVLTEKLADSAEFSIDTMKKFLFGLFKGDYTFQKAMNNQRYNPIVVASAYETLMKVIDMGNPNEN
jgi:hypothetical protein